MRICYRFFGIFSDHDTTTRQNLISPASRNQVRHHAFLFRVSHALFHFSEIHDDKKRDDDTKRFGSATQPTLV
jgi:hypothetical protein